MGLTMLAELRTGSGWTKDADGAQDWLKKGHDGHEELHRALKFLFLCRLPNLEFLFYFWISFLFLSLFSPLSCRHLILPA